jgi:hypothetical protein
MEVQMNATSPPSFSVGQITEILRRFSELRLISQAGMNEALALFHPGFPFIDQLAMAESIHLHVKVADVAKLPHDDILSLGAHAESQKDGYIKYSFPCGVNMIFSSIDVAEEDLIPSQEIKEKPFLDHVGIDIRKLSLSSREVFHGIPTKVKQVGWGHVHQGSITKPVFCCHTSVSEKEWAFPHGCSRHFRPIEFAFGPLHVSQNQIGCDLRPIDPQHPDADKVPTSCCA